MYVIAKVVVSLHVHEPELPSLDAYNKDAEGKVLTDFKDIEFAKGVESARRRVVAYPISFGVSGKRDVLDVADAHRLSDSIKNYVDAAFRSLSIGEHKGTHVPDLTAAKGGMDSGSQVRPTMAELRASAPVETPPVLLVEAPAGATVVPTKPVLPPPPKKGVVKTNGVHTNGVKKNGAK